MGPPGHQARTTVRDCWALEMNRLRREGRFHEPPAGGQLTWRGSRHGERLGPVEYELESLDGELALTLRYTVQGRRVELPVSIERRPQPFGGARWWFRCPLVQDGAPCLRRCGVLYLPPGGRWFGCRRCLDLTYTSCQESHQWDATARSIAARLGLSCQEVLEQIGSMGKLERAALKRIRQTGAGRLGRHGQEGQRAGI